MRRRGVLYGFRIVTSHCPFQFESSRLWYLPKNNARAYNDSSIVSATLRVQHKSRLPPIKIFTSSIISTRHYRHYSSSKRSAFSLSDSKMESTYRFPDTKLKQVLKDESKTPLVVVSCGSFSPITYLHLRMFEMCQDWVRENTDYEIIGAYLSPVADAYEKDGLAKAKDRIEMCQLAAADSNWIMVDDWEAIKKEYTRTALVLDHLSHEINEVRSGIKTRTGECKKVQISLLSGADLLLSMLKPGVWSDEDIDHMLRLYGAYIVERSGTDLNAAIDGLSKWKSDIHSIPQPIPNDVSSTKIRQFLKRGSSVRYLIPDAALQYIEKHGLFR